MRKVKLLLLIFSISLFSNLAVQAGETPSGLMEANSPGDQSQGVEIMDQTQWLYDYGYWLDDTMVRFQEFIPTIYNMTSLYIHVNRVGNPGNLIVQIRNLGGSVLAQKDFTYSEVPLTGWLLVDFTQFTVIPGTKYRIYVYSNTDSPNPTNRYFWNGSASSTYCDKCENSISGSTPTYDFAFTTHGVGVKSPTVADFDGNHSTEISVYRPSNGKWFLKGLTTVQWGLAGDIPVPGHYFCNMEIIAVYRPSNGKWYIRGLTPVSWGFPGDIPVPADYDGDGVDEIAVLRPSNGKWYIREYGLVNQNFSWYQSGDIPVPCDYDGDYADEIAVYRPSNGKWFIKGYSPISWGFPDDIPVPGDYNGDKLCDIAVYRPSNGNWYIAGQGMTSWGHPGDIPVPGDYDGCGDTEIAVLRPSNGKWYIQGMGNFFWYFPGDYPLPVSDTNADGDPYH